MATPNAVAALSEPIYADSSGQTLLQNTNGYLIVPTSYNISNAITFGQILEAANGFILGASLAAVYVAFKQNGTQDLQRD